MAQIRWLWSNPKFRQVMIGLWLIGALFAFYSEGLPKLWSNLGRINRNYALLVARPATSGTSNEDLSQAVRFFERSKEFDACNPLGFFAPSVMACTKVKQWEKITITGTYGVVPPVYLAPSDLTDIKYGQALSLILPTQEFSNLGSLTLLTYTGHSTRIQQGELVAYAFVITTAREVYLLPLRAGLETAEGSYDFPDVPPQHAKPNIYYSRIGDGVAYPVHFRFEPSVSPEVIVIVFTYAPRWHVEPILKVWAVYSELIS